MEKFAVIFASSECEPFAKTGGMADVVSALSKELSKYGLNISIFLPFYKHIQSKKNIKIKNLNLKTIVRINSFFKESNFFQTTLQDSNISVYLVKNDEYFFRDHLYSENGSDYPDNLERFVLFNKSILNFILMKEWNVKLIHCHDWQTALIPVYLKLIYSNDPILKNIKTLFTIHNFGYQGIFNINEYYKLDLGWEHFTIDKMEFYGKINLLKAALIFSDAISTVSETYKKELLEKEDISKGLTFQLRAKADKFFGILNGVDYDIWDPAKDKYIKKNYDSSSLSNKLLCKKELLKLANLKGIQKPLLIMISRLVAIKGLDILIPALDNILKMNVNLIILGNGEPTIEAKLSALERKYKNFKLFLKFDEEMAHKMQAGGDILLMPSISEPCGLNQLYSLKYGTVPIVYYTGGLADTIIDYNKDNKKGTGFVFYEHTSNALTDTIYKAISLYNKKSEWRKIQKNGMKQDFSWKKSAGDYLQVYLKIIT